MAWIYQLSTLSDTPLSATLLPMIPRSALISSAGSGRLRQGFGGCRGMNRARGGVQTKNQKRGERSQSLSWFFFIRTSTLGLFFTPHPLNPVRILSNLADFIPSQPFAPLLPQSISFGGCSTGQSGLSQSARHIPLPPEPTIASCSAYPQPPNALPCLSCLQLPA